MAKIEKYYTILEHMADVFDKSARTMGAVTDSAETFEQWQKAARKQLWKLLALDMMTSCEARVEILESIQMDGFRREKIVLQTEPEVWMPLYVLIPDGLRPNDKRPAFIEPHGHGPGKSGTVNATEYEEIVAMNQRFAAWGERPRFSHEMARAGYIVFAPDARGAGERREFTTQGDGDFYKNSHAEINNMAISMGMNMCGMMVWDMMRLVDYILQRPDYNGQIGVGGMSGGGQQALFLAACDERIACAMTSGWFYGFKESFLRMPHNCACNFVPDLWRYFDCGDIGALIAPRPFLIESGDHDPLSGAALIENVYPQVKVTKAGYESLGQQERLWHHVFDGGHQWSGEKALPFFAQYLPVEPI